MKGMSCKRIWGISAASLLLACPPQLGALEILVDPGAVGSSFSTTSIPFDDLIGTPLEGQALSLDLIFDDMKNLSAEIFSSPNPLGFYTTTLEFGTDLSGLPELPSVIDGFLSDANGDSIASPLTTSSFGRGDGSFGVNLNFVESIADNLIHHDIHFSVILPQENASITSSTLGLGFDPVGAQGEIQVGRVPEPTTLALLSLGLAGLGFTRHRMKA